MVKKGLIIIFLILIVCTSCTRSPKHGTSVREGTYTCDIYDYGCSIRAIKGEETYEFPTYDKLNRKEEVREEFDLKFRLEVKEISQEEYEKANGLNVLKDLTYKGKNECYSIKVLVGYSLDTLEQIDFIYIKEWIAVKDFRYWYDRGDIVFGANDVYLCIKYKKGKTYNNIITLDTLDCDEYYIDMIFAY